MLLASLSIQRLDQVVTLRTTPAIADALRSEAKRRGLPVNRLVNDALLAILGGHGTEIGASREGQG